MDSLLDGRRLVIAHNPNSSRARSVERQVFDSLDAAGFDYEKLEVEQAPLAENVERLAKLIRKDDIILSAAGDGSAHAIANTVIEADQTDVLLGFLAFGNFNDLPHAFNNRPTSRDPRQLLENAKPRVVYPLEVEVDGAVQRSALLYATIGWTAKAAAELDRPGARAELQHSNARLLTSLGRLGLFYFGSRKSSLLPELQLNGNEPGNLTDILCVNSPNLARLFHTEVPYYERPDFLCRPLDVSKLMPNLPFLADGLLLGKMTGDEVRRADIKFDQPRKIPMQCDGEAFQLENVSEITIKKSDQALTILSTS